MPDKKNPETGVAVATGEQRTTEAAATYGLAGLGVTFTQMFRKPNTEQYPEEVKETAERFHGRHVLNRHPDGLEKCVGCELCAWACPADAIFVEGADNTEEARFSPGERYGINYQINYTRCIFCGLCIEACPTRALTMSNEFELASDSREDLIYTKDRLLTPLLEGQEQPPHPMRLGNDEYDYYARTFEGNERGAGAPGTSAAGMPGEVGATETVAPKTGTDVADVDADGNPVASAHPGPAQGLSGGADKPSRGDAAKAERESKEDGE